MRFDTFSAFLYMDGQGLYIWAAYAITGIVLFANVCWPLLVRRKMIRQATLRQADLRQTQPGDIK